MYEVGSTKLPEILQLYSKTFLEDFTDDFQVFVTAKCLQI